MTSIRSRFVSALSITVIAGGCLLFGTPLRAEVATNPNFSVTATILNTDGTPNTLPVTFYMTTDLGLDAAIRDKYDIYGTWVTASLVFNQATSKNPIRAMAYWVCPIPSQRAEDTLMHGLQPLCQQVDFRTKDTFALTFQYRAANKRIHGRITDEKGAPLGSTLGTTSTFSVMSLWRPTTPYYRGGEQQMVLTDASGNYVLPLSDRGGSFDLGPQPGNYREFQRIWGFDHAVTFLNDISAEDYEVNFVLYRTGTSVIKGRMLDKLGQPVSGVSKNYIAAAHAYQTTTPFTGTVTSPGADGRFELHLTAGTYQVFLTHVTIPATTQWTLYPGQTITIADGQTINLGDLYPGRVLTLDPSQPNPGLVYIGGNQREVAQTGATKQARYIESFSSLGRIDLARTAGVTWSHEAMSMNAVAASSSGLRAAGLVSLASAPVSATITSVPVTPKNLRIKTVTLIAAQTITGTGSISYDVSPDGVEWLRVVPGQTTAIPGGWNTAKGLRWRATLQRTSTTDMVIVADVQIAYAYQNQRAAPLVTKVGIKRQGLSMKLTIRAKYLSSSAVVYVGAKKVTAVIKSGVATTTIKRSSFPKRLYRVTVVNPDLQLSSTPIINVLLPRQ